MSDQPGQGAGATRAAEALAASGIPHALTAHGPVRSLQGAAEARGVEPRAIDRGPGEVLGSSTAWPVVADATVVGRTISIGAGAHGVAATAYGNDVIRALGAEVQDVTEPVAGQHD
ncbi:MAG: hypothetical protein ABI131_05685 [Nostocoides sp.]